MRNPRGKPRLLNAHQVQTLPSSGCPWYCKPSLLNRSNTCSNSYYSLDIYTVQGLGPCASHIYAKCSQWPSEMGLCIILLFQWLSGKESTCIARDSGVMVSIPGLERFPWRRKWQTTPVFLQGKSHGPDGLQPIGSQRAGYD